jgi:hypothetical protein
MDQEPGEKGKKSLPHGMADKKTSDIIPEKTTLTV